MSLPCFNNNVIVYLSRIIVACFTDILWQVTVNQSVPGFRAHCFQHYVPHKIKYGAEKLSLMQVAYHSLGMMLFQIRSENGLKLLESHTTLPLFVGALILVTTAVLMGLHCYVKVWETYREPTNILFAICIGHPDSGKSQGGICHDCTRTSAIPITPTVVNTCR